MKIIECVPNLSEGRNHKALAQLRKNLTQISGLDLRHICSDPDHHRTVLSLFAEPPIMKQGLLALFEWALEHIDMTKHIGIHPRIGAVDVVPLIPIQGVSEQETKMLSQKWAKDIAEHFQLPIYMYAKSAMSPQRVKLAHIRQGQFEGLSQKMERPEWAPDFGSKNPHPKLGASVFGVRGSMIAFNIMLDQNNLPLARAIARDIRESSGGVPGIQALGLHLEHLGLSQVSMNIFEHCPLNLFQIVEKVRALALEKQVNIKCTEIIGLVPQSQLVETALAYLEPLGWDQNQNFSPSFKRDPS